MLFKHTIRAAFSGLMSHKSRSVLTILGIVIGISAIIMIVSLGRGARDLIIGQIQGMGSKTIVVAPGREPQGPSDVAQIFSDSLKEKDLIELRKKSNAPGINEIAPVVFGGESAAYSNETYRLTIFGSSELITKILDVRIGEGIFFTDDDIKNRADVVVIGSKVKEKLFGQSQAIGEKIKIKNRSFKVIGVLEKKGQVSFFNFDETAIIPHTTAQQYIFGIKHFHRFIIETKSDDLVDETVRDIEITLRNSHNITDPEKDDFFIETQVDLANRLSVITDILTLFLVSVAAISLLVGGIGIMNIMLVSVTERTREIGLRKAIGATESDILKQFLFEAVILTSTGGIIGIALGGFASFVVSVILSNFVGLNWVFTFPVSAAILGFGISATVGVIFGLYPARQASKKSPMEALRYE